MKYVMFDHGGSNNHGCEAIVRSTINILGNKNRYYLQSFSPEADKRFFVDDITKIVTSKDYTVERTSMLGLILRAKSRLPHQPDFDIQQSVYRHKNLLKKGSIALSIGGDNYCYGLEIIDFIRDQITAFREKDIPVVLWGCSINPENITGPVLNDLKKYSFITARESITYHTLDNLGLSDKVLLCADPAFTLPAKNTQWEQNAFMQSRVIGINISTLMKNYDTYENATYRNFKCLIEYLLNKTDYYIALIPHVRQAGNDDLVPSLELAKEFSSDRILVADEDFNCMELKYIISKCKMFIGCRTHSTIAAYSTCVPTLVVGYSTKAKGIAKDIFGDYNDLLVDAREFKSDNDLLDKFLKFDERKGELKDHLERFMPEYINRAYLAKVELEKVLKYD